VPAYSIHSGGSSSGSRGAPAPPRPKNTMEPPLHFGEEKMRKKERKKRGKKKSAPPLRISGFATA